MKVSIIIPAFNNQDTIAETIYSAINQTYLDREIFVIDDGSTDQTVSIVKNFPVSLIERNHTGDPAETRNTGILNTDGQYILPLDADDKIDLKYLEKTVPLMQAGIGFVSTGMQYFGIEKIYIPIKKRTYEEQLYSNEIPVCSLIDREAVLECGGYQTGVPGWEDWFLWLDILSRNWRMASINEPLFHYRRRENHLGTKGWTFRDEYARIIRKRHPKFLGGENKN